jgi:hypothetical protein
LAEHILADKQGGQFGLTLRAVAERYAEVAAAWVPRYEHDALFNGLRYDREDELNAVSIFVEVLSGIHREPKVTPGWPAANDVLADAGVRDAVAGLGVSV